MIEIYILKTEIVKRNYMICYKVSSPMEEKKKKKAEQDEVYTL